MIFSLKVLPVLGSMWLISIPLCDATIRCFECKDMYKPYLCDTVTFCADNEECFVDQFVTSGGQTLYNSGCRSKQRCSLGKRDLEVQAYYKDNATVPEDTSSDIITCQTCCNDTNYCNYQGCRQAPLGRSQRGPYCFECSNQDEQGCRHVTHCDLNYACEITSKTIDTFRLYDSRCVHITPTSRCNTTYKAPYSQPIAVGKRATTRDICFKCCDTDFCNDDCSETQLHVPQQPIDGGVSDWSAWTSCSATCGGGTMSRQRSCTDPSPAFGGKPCSNQLSETRSCEILPCTTDAPIIVTWTQWTKCTESCGPSGVQQRDKICFTAADMKPDLYLCQDPLYERRGCNTEVYCPDAPIIVTWTQWTKCTESCGPSGVQQRDKICFTAADMKPDLYLCQDPLYERRGCNTEVYCPADGQWGQWSEWSACPVTCGKGTKSRSRDCNSPPPINGGKNCYGNKTEQAVCGGGACNNKVNGGWANWQDWSHCSVKCGSGIRIRTRNCTHPVPSNGGEVCHGNALESHVCYHSCQDSSCGHSPGYSLRTYNVPSQNATRRICMKMYNISSTWYAARSQCMQDGADLLTYTSQNNHLNHVFQRFPGNYVRFWIGLEYINDQWTWVDGATGLGQFGHTMLGTHFTNHIRFLVSGFADLRGCVADNGHDWLPRDCNEQHPFVCEKHGHFH